LRVRSRAREPKSIELGAALREHDVAGLQIAVDDTRAVRPVERVGNLDADPERLAARKRAFAEARRERFAFDELHDEVVDVAFATHVVEDADVGMVEPRDGLRLALETRAHFAVGREMLREHLDGDVAAQARVARAIHLACRPRRAGDRRVRRCHGNPHAADWRKTGTASAMGYFSPEMRKSPPVASRAADRRLAART
jgi:hypothetical protein